jgi:serine/threonine-protein kinase HipA
MITKNISFILHEQKNWQLAPAYDLIYAYNPKGERTYQHLMSVNGKFNHIQREDLLILPDRFQVGAASRLFAEVGNAVAAWPEFARQAQVSKEAVNRIRNHHALL